METVVSHHQTKSDKQQSSDKDVIDSSEKDCLISKKETNDENNDFIESKAKTTTEHINTRHGILLIDKNSDDDDTNNEKYKDPDINDLDYIEQKKSIKKFCSMQSTPDHTRNNINDDKEGGTATTTNEWDEITRKLNESQIDIELTESHNNQKTNNGETDKKYNSEDSDNMNNGNNNNNKNINVKHKNNTNKKPHTNTKRKKYSFNISDVLRDEKANELYQTYCKSKVKFYRECTQLGFTDSLIDILIHQFSNYRKQE